MHQANALLRGLEPEIPTTASITLCARDAAETLNLVDAIAQSADQLLTMASPLRPEDIDVRSQDVQNQAAAALAAGVGDIRRVEVLARSLPVTEGFRALAELLRCTDSHESWHTTIEHVIGSFRDADTRFARQIAEQALLSPQADFDTCNREQIGRLATVLENYGQTTPRR